MNRAYAPHEVLVTVGGLPITAKGDDEFLTVAFNEDAATLTVGVDGEAALSFNKNESGRFTIRVMQGSEANDILTGIFVAFKANKVLVPIFVKDLNGRSTYLGAKCWPVKLPESAFAKQAGIREWVFETDVLVVNIGGNNFL